MKSFNIEVSLESGKVNLTVIPYEYPTDSRNTAFELVMDKVWIGSIHMNEESKWEGFGGLPWANEDIRKIGFEITNHYI